MEALIIMKKQISSDLKAAIEYNGTSFTLADIISIEAEIPGENDENSWFWILDIDDRGFLLFSGSCDYSGWDCQSGVKEHGFFKTALDAAMACPENEPFFPQIQVRDELINQVRTGETFSLTVKTWKIS